METVKTIERIRSVVRQERASEQSIGLVPTMGALHAGHISLIKRSLADGHFTVVSIFVNPTQFAPNEDLGKYPRPLQKDLSICRESGVDAVFVPTVDEIYGDGYLTWVDVEKLTDTLCGATRPEHFRGVATVCAKLFNIVGPDVAYFGQKDAQQCVVIKRMVADLNMPLQIVVCPTVRERDGLAVSSRNKYLNREQRKDAKCLYKSLKAARRLVEQGVTDAKHIIAEMTEIIEDTPCAGKIDYISIVDPETLADLDQITGKTLVALAVCVGPARLIDNMILSPPGGTPAKND
jgi:pantoate--beta-alanine ligase